MRLALALLLPALLAGPALTASNAIPAAATGAGSGVVSGYTASSISYSLTGDAVGRVSFALSPPGAATVKARLAPGEPWTTCTIVVSTVSCALATAAAAAVSLEIVAAG